MFCLCRNWIVIYFNYGVRWSNFPLVFPSNDSQLISTKRGVISRWLGVIICRKFVPSVRMRWLSTKSQVFSTHAGVIYGWGWSNFPSWLEHERFPSNNPQAIWSKRGVISRHGCMHACTKWNDMTYEIGNMIYEMKWLMNVMNADFQNRVEECLAANGAKLSCWVLPQN